MPSLLLSARHRVPEEHPRLLGSREELRALADARPEAYQRMVAVARERDAGDHAKMISMGLVCAIENDASLGRATVERAMKYIDGPIRRGHVTFGHDLARCALAYDLCYEHWTAEQRARFHQYMNKTVDENSGSESHVFHNGWYGYKHWGIGLACYATYYENPRAPDILAALNQDWRTRAAPALRLAGNGGGWAEGYYINYWLYEWLFFSEVARRCEGVNYYEDAPEFFANRAVAGMFEIYPGIRTYGSRRPIPMGDGGGRLFGGDRDKNLSSRRILVNYYRHDQDHQSVHTFNEATPRSSVGVYAYKDFLWRDPGVGMADLEGFKLSHLSPGPGYVCARSSWDEDATYFFFKCGDRFTAHQHLDVGHFLIFKHEELVGDGGHYDAFGSPHDVNYHLRSIAHNTILVHDPDESWPAIRAGAVSGNDGGQAHAWPHHNGAVSDPQAWERDEELYDVGDILAFEDSGDYVYIAADCARAYAPHKVTAFVRQIAFIRPDTVLVFDRVHAGNPEFKKTWLLHVMTPPTVMEDHLVVTNGQGRLFVQTLLPRDPRVSLAAGADLYRYDGADYPPARDTGPAPECRIEVSPTVLNSLDYFLHVLTATKADVTRAAPASVDVRDGQVLATCGRTIVAFSADELGGEITIDGRREPLATTVVTAPPVRVVPDR
jgi:hypothetical protein